MRLIDADALDIDSFPIGDDEYEDEDECVLDPELTIVGEPVLLILPSLL